MINRAFDKTQLPGILFLLALCILSSCSQKGGGDNVVDPVEDEVPGTPILYDPGESVYSGENFSLEWTSADYAESYIIEVSGNSAFTDYKNIYTTIDTSRVLSKEVTTTKQFFIRVKAVNGSTKSASWSNIVDVVVINRKPALYGPENTLLSANRYDLTWSDADYSSYILEESENDTFLNSTQHQVNGLSYSFTRVVREEMKLYFRVKGINDEEDAEWSDTLKLTLYNLLQEFECDLVPIPAGTFIFGHPDDPRSMEVTLSDFYMTSTEITAGLYKLITNNTLVSRTKKYLPVVDVDWFQAVKFCNKLSVIEGLETCYDENTWECDLSKNGYRLPTEAEWEYACRAGTSTWYYSGDTEQDLDRVAYYIKNSHVRVQSVGGKIPNNFGLFDMLGNANEWVNDWFSDNYGEGGKDPTGPKTGVNKVFRGGNVESYYHGCHSYARYRAAPDFHNKLYYLSFRIVRR